MSAYKKTSPRCCPECGSIAIIRLEDVDNCKRCGAKRKRMSPLYHGVSDPTSRGYTAVYVPGSSSPSYMKRPHKPGNG
jgi:hypothetical protein